MGKTSATSKNKYNQKAYDRISYMVPAGGRAAIQVAAAAAHQSVNGYITQAVNARLIADGYTAVNAHAAGAPDSDSEPDDD